MTAWRYRTPCGHHNWERYMHSKNGEYLCRSCEEWYETLIDWKTKQPKDRIQ